MLVVSVTAVSFGAVSYAPSDSYTVSADTPTCLEALEACKTADPAWDGEYVTVYFKAPADWYNKFNTLPGTDYGQICVYWWSGAGSKWPDGAEVKWVGYKCELVDKENRIFAAYLPADTDNTPMILFNNGVNGGMDPKAEIYNYAAQVKNLNTQGAAEDEFDTIPEGSINEYDFDGCIAIPDPNRTSKNELSGVTECEIDWYIYYGDGCYGSYAPGSAMYHGQFANCLNPEHDHPKPGDVNKDKAVNVLDAELIQKYIVKLEELDSEQKVIADVDGDGVISVIDSARIQRYLAGYCEMDGTVAG
jgi:hypothetical protein